MTHLRFHKTPNSVSSKPGTGHAADVTSSNPDVDNQLCVEPQSPAEAAEATQVRNINFPAGHRPIYAGFQFFMVTIRNGVVQDITMYTTGIASQELILAELELKFGHPKLLKMVKESNMMGATFKVANATWKIGSDEVSLMGSIGQFDAGLIEAKSADEKAYEAAEQAKQQKGVPDL